MELPKQASTLLVPTESQGALTVKWSQSRSHKIDIESENSSRPIVYAGSDRRLSAWTIGYELDTEKEKKKSVELFSVTSSKKTETEEEEEDGEGEEEELPWLERTENRAKNWYKKHRRRFRIAFITILLILYLVYVLWAVLLRYKKVGIKQHLNLDYCSGVGFLVILTTFIAVIYCYNLFISKIYHKYLRKHVHKRVMAVYYCFVDKTVKRIAYGMISLFFVVFLVFDGIKHKQKLRSSAGVLVFTVICFIFSKHRSKIPWSQVYWGLVVQYAFALLILYWGVGETVIRCISSKIRDFVETSNHGAVIIFDFLVVGTKISVIDTRTGNATEYIVDLPWVLGFKMVPAVLFFSCVLSILFYYGVLQWFVIKMAYFLQKTMGTSAAESINSAANVFLGATEAPLIIRPFLSQMTKSELHAILTTGFATIAGTMFTVYVTFGLDPVHLMSAAFMSAPAALAYSKILYPETEPAMTNVKDVKLHKGSAQDANVFAAAANGTIAAIPVVSSIVANLITFISLLKLINLVIAWAASLIGYYHITLEYLLGKLFVPAVYLMGIEWESCDDIGTLIGLKVIISEFIAYKELLDLDAKGLVSKRDMTIAVYVLCGFSNVSAIGMQLGTLSALAPERMGDMAEVVLRAFFAGLLTSFLTACIAGSLLIV